MAPPARPELNSVGASAQRLCAPGSLRAVDPAWWLGKCRKRTVCSRGRLRERPERADYQDGLQAEDGLWGHLRRRKGPRVKKVTAPGEEWDPGRQEVALRPPRLGGESRWEVRDTQTSRGPEPPAGGGGRGGPFRPECRLPAVQPGTPSTTRSLGIIPFLEQEPGPAGCFLQRRHFFLSFAGSPRCPL